VPDGYAILVACILLNCTTRKQVEKVLPELLRSWSTADELSKADPEQLERCVRTLGFGNRRTRTLLKFSLEFTKGFEDVRTLPGVGEYAARSYEIFCLGVLGDNPPKDHALVKVWKSLKMQSSM
jgi:methyl-CpG-binding domain protein 4